MISVLIPSIVAISGLIYWDNNRLTKSSYSIYSLKIPKEFNGFKILQLSDLHSKSFGKANEKLIKLIDKECPNVIVMTGDMINSRERIFTTFLHLAGSLTATYDVYFVEGNNEAKLPKECREELLKRLKEYGIKVLNNNKVSIVKNEQALNIYGLWFDLQYYKEIHSEYNKNTYWGNNEMESALKNCNDKEYNILLAHNPLYFDSYAKWGADLTLSGHVHGGLIRIPGVGGLLSPERKFFPKYSEGKYNIRERDLIVNRGLGSKIIIPRILNSPEVSVVNLYTRDKEEMKF